MPHFETVKCCDNVIDYIMEINKDKDKLYSCSICGNQMIEPNEYYDI